ncbi:MAG: YhcN/YlaJ family sporulation lipoprotein [Clostridia bacterium]|nr:YhcN/YlaJ family sporulation lipoprotein [Clostridia bacterium]
MKKTLLALSLTAAAGMMLTSCAAGMEPTPSASPSASPTVTVTNVPAAEPETMPDSGADSPMGLLPDESASPDPTAEGVTSVSDARKAVESIEDELEKLSEVDNAQVMLAGNTAVVALEFDDQYQGGLDDRLREIVRERVNGVISGVSVIEITDDLGLMGELEKLGDSLDGAADMDSLRSEMEKIIQRITGGSAA